jgi:two-component system sensor kinase
LTNVARHSTASRADVELTVSGHRVRVTVADDGVGFTIDDDVLGSLGLAGMRERASLVDGRLEIISGPGEGTTVVLEVPG